MLGARVAATARQPPGVRVKPVKAKLAASDIAVQPTIGRRDAEAPGQRGRPARAARRPARLAQRRGRARDRGRRCGARRRLVHEPRPADRGRPLPHAHHERAGPRLEGGGGQPLRPRGNGRRARLRARRHRDPAVRDARAARRAVRRSRCLCRRLRRAGRRWRHEPGSGADALRHGDGTGRSPGAPGRRGSGRRRVRDGAARGLARRARAARGARPAAPRARRARARGTCIRCRGWPRAARWPARRTP